jgi:nucleoside-diphosphate-sugar epimerase
VKALVTGATGFLGGALVRRLRGLGWDVTGLGRDPKKLNELEDAGIRPLHADIRKKNQVSEAVKEQEFVFHCAAFPSPWGNYELFYQANVIGARNVARACLENKVKRLVYVSTPSIYFEYASRMSVKESDPLPEPISNYARTKLLAEEEIDRGVANGLAAISIRPRALFGEGDTVIFPRLIRRIRSGGLPILGDGENIVDLTYIDNVVDALFAVRGVACWHTRKKYNISNGEPVKIWKLIERICDELKYPRPRRRISCRAAHAVAGILESVYTLIPFSPEPPLTRLSVSMMSNSSTLDISAARNELGYQPNVSIEEGVGRFLKWWKEKNPK